MANNTPRHGCRGSSGFTTICRFVETMTAMTWLERGFVIPDPGLVYLKSDDIFAPLRDNPRFQALLEKMHLAD